MTSAATLKIDPWKPHLMRANPFIAAVGRRGSGKSSIMFTLLYALRHRFDAVFVFVPTNDVYQKMLKILPAAFVFQSILSEDLLQVILATMTELLSKGRAKTIAIFTDDTSFDISFLKSKVCRELAYNGRNCNITWFCSMQSSVDAPTYLRDQVDYVLLMSENVVTTKKNLYVRYAGIFESYDQFNRAFKRVTRDYTAMVLDQTRTTGAISDSVFYFKGVEFDKLPKERNDCRCNIPVPHIFHVCKNSFYVLDCMFRNGGNRGNPDDEDAEKNKNKIVIHEQPLSDFTKI